MSGGNCLAQRKLNERRSGMLRGVKLGTKIIAGFLLVTAIAGLMGIVGYLGMGRIMFMMNNELLGKRLPSIRNILILKEAQQAVLVGERGLG
jgi:hypothetical protein